MMTAPLSRNLLRAFWLGVGLLAVYVLLQLRSAAPLQLLLGCLMAFCAVLPSFFWCAGRVAGLPIFPAMAVTYLWTFALPVLMGHPALERYDDNAVLRATLTVVLFLGVATAVWLYVVRTPAPVPRTHWSFPDQGNNTIFQLCLLLACLFLVAANAGWLAVVSASVFSLIRAISLGLAVLAITVLSHRLGRGQLPRGQTIGFVILFVLILFLRAAGLMLAPTMALFLVAVGTYIVGRRRIPFRIVLAALAVFTILHLGKMDLRAQYWKKNWFTLPPQEYPRFYARWFAAGVSHIPDMLSEGHSKSKRRESLVQRSSLLQMLLLVQDKSPEHKPYLYGQTYAIIPELLVPRVLYANKVRSHEGTYILAIHYDRQTRKATLSTTIGFGLLSEAFANFGYAGVVGLAVLLGAGAGWVTRWSMHVPIASLRGLFSLLVLSVAIQTEWTGGVLVSSLFQSGVTLLIFAAFTMRACPVADSSALVGSAVTLGEAS